MSSHVRARTTAVVVAALAVALAACVPVGTTPSGWSSTLAYAHDFPDPSIVLVGSTYYGFSTNADMGTGCGFAQVPVIQSTDLQHWTSDCNALPHVGSWANDANPAQETTKTTWAPAVVQLGPSSFVMYYTAQHRGTTQQCIGVATSTTPQGPYVDSSATPLACTGTSYWSLDPAFFRDTNGTPYLLWRQDSAPTSSPALSPSLAAAMTRSNTAYREAAASGGVHVGIDVQRLSTDGLTFASGSAPVELLSNDVGAQAWETPVIEGPGMVIDPRGTYLLLYSGGDYKTSGTRSGTRRAGRRCPRPAAPAARARRTRGCRRRRRAGPKRGPVARRCSPTPAGTCSSPTTHGYRAPWTRTRPAASSTSARSASRPARPRRRQRLVECWAVVNFLLTIPHGQPRVAGHGSTAARPPRRSHRARHRAEPGR